MEERKTEFDKLKSVEELLKTDNTTLYQILDEINERLKKIENFLSEEFLIFKH